MPALWPLRTLPSVLAQSLLRTRTRLAGQVSGDPVMGLKASNPAVGPLIESFSFLAIVTSFIGFILGLSDFLCDALPIQNSSARIPAYLLTLVPAYGLALAFPDIFFAALDTVRRQFGHLHAFTFPCKA